MKDAKIFPLLLISLILLLMASLILLYTWGYYKFYYKDKADIHNSQPITKKNMTNVDDDYRDSLQKIYVSAIRNHNTSIDTTIENTASFPLNSEISPEGYYKLRNEIERILKNHPLKADLEIARQKIVELQKRLSELNNKSELKNKNINVEDDNNRLYGRITELDNENNGVQQKKIPSKTENNFVTKSTQTNSIFTVSQLHITAFMSTDGVDQETIRADQTDKIDGIITVKSNITQGSSEEIIVVVLKPDGRVMQGSSWESGTFDTRDGRKIYSTKLRFVYSTNESKRLAFSISSDKYQKGEYTIQVYYKGIIIGKAAKILI